MKQCLYCYQPVDNETEFHPRCSKKIFGSLVPPVVPYSESDIDELALELVRSRNSVTGVQPKLSVEITTGASKAAPKRFTIVGLWGDYILKPPTSQYPHLPEVEDVTMHLASLSKITCVPHSLIRLQSGCLAYITKRIDRTKQGKVHMEDMCQITERLTEDKYYGSYEQIAKAIIKYSVNPLLDCINFYEMVLFSFLTGNADMHLKNFSLMCTPGIGYHLAPAYDMVSTALVHPADTEELALALNGKKRTIGRKDFMTAFAAISLDNKTIESMMRKFEKSIPLWYEFIEHSFLPEDMKVEFVRLIQTRAEQIRLEI